MSEWVSDLVFWLWQFVRVLIQCQDSIRSVAMVDMMSEATSLESFFSFCFYCTLSSISGYHTWWSIDKSFDFFAATNYYRFLCVTIILLLLLLDFFFVDIDNLTLFCGFVNNNHRLRSVWTHTQKTIFFIRFLYTRRIKSNIPFLYRQRNDEKLYWQRWKGNLK